MRPPHRSRASTIVTLLPARASSRAVMRPAAPAPTTRKFVRCRGVIDHGAAVCRAIRRLRPCAQLRRHVILLGKREKSAEPKRLFKECHGGIERTLRLCDREGDLLGEARPDVVVGADAEGVEA